MWLAAALGLALLVVAWAVGSHGDEPDSFGTVAAATTGSTALSTAAPPSRPDSVSVLPAPPVRPAPPNVITDLATLTIDATDVRAPIVPILSAGGVLSPPDDASTVGWWIASALPGSESGATVIVGHVDSPAGEGALFRLRDVEAGAVVSVADPSGRAVNYVVSALNYLDKDEPLPPDLFAQSGPARLVLVSCGGDFNRQTAQYSENVVVLAYPAT